MSYESGSEPKFKQPIMIMKPMPSTTSFPSPRKESPPEASCTAKGRQPLKTLALALSCLTLVGGGAHAGLTNRYIFDDNVNDSGIGGINGVPTGATANLEPPSFVTDIPAGTVAGAPTKSMQVGMSYGTKKSGVTLASQVFNEAQGSMSFWVKATSLENQNYLFTTTTPGTGLFMVATGATSVRNRAAGTSLFDATVAAGTWYYVAITWNDTTGTHALYLNGSPVSGTSSFTAGALVAQALRIGGFTFSDDGSNVLNQFAGQFYDLHFYDHVLTPAEVTFLRQNPGGVISEASLAHRYVFGDNVNDSFGGRNGTATSNNTNIEAPGFATVVPAGATGPAKSIEFGMNIGTKKSGFTLPTTVISDQAAAGAVAMFIRPESDANDTDLRYVFAALPGASGFTIGQIFNGSNQVLRRTVTGNGADFVMTAGSWYHVVLTWKQSGPDLLANFYVNGSLMGNSRLAAKSITGLTAVRVGGFNLANDATQFANQFDGRMYDLQVYNGLLHSAQVAQLNTSPGAVISESVTLAHRYMFDDSVRDAIGGRNGTATLDNTNIEAPLFGTVVPSGATGPAKSIEFGMNIGTKKSGFTLPAQVFSAQAAAGSVAMFVRPESDAGADFRYVLTVDPTASGLVIGQILSGPNQVLRGSLANTAVSSFTMTAGQWYHLVLTWKQAGPDLLASYYVNGSLIGNSRLAAKSVTATGTHRVGGFNLSDNGLNFANQFDGRMYDLQVYNGVLNPAQVTQLNASPGAVIPEVTPPFTELNPSAPVPASYVLKKEWHWATDGSLDGWTPENFTVNLPGDVSGSVVTGTSGASTDPQFISPDFTSTAPASGGRIIEIGVITDVGGTGNSPELFWQADELGEFSADRRVELPVLPADGAAHVIRVTFTGDIVGILNNFRFDPSRSANIISKIDYVRIYTDGPSDFTEGSATSYASWSDGAPADGDANADGVPNAVAFALGAADPDENAIRLLPDFEYDNTGVPTYLVFTFNRSDEAQADPKTVISVEYGSNLIGWSTAVHDPGGTGVIINETPGSPTDAVEVKIPISESEAPDDNKLFARMKVVVTP